MGWTGGWGKEEREGRRERLGRVEKGEGRDGGRADIGAGKKISTLSEPF